MDSQQARSAISLLTCAGIMAVSTGITATSFPIYPTDRFAFTATGR